MGKGIPADSTVVIKDLEISTNQMPKIPQKKDRVLWLGDSITQGYGPLRSGMTYVSVANRILNYDIINQGIGAFIYDADSLMELSGYDPDKIVVRPDLDDAMKSFFSTVGDKFAIANYTAIQPTRAAIKRYKEGKNWLVKTFQNI